MKWSFASVGLIMLGLFGIVIIMLFNDITVSNEQDYYNLKESTEAAMLESVDTAYYRLTGDVKIVQEKFVENFTRRFTETSTFGQGNYGISFYQIIEYPPKVSIRIYDLTSGYNIYTYTSDVSETQVNVVNELSAILDGEKNEENYIPKKLPDDPTYQTPTPPNPPDPKKPTTPDPNTPDKPKPKNPNYKTNGNNTNGTGGCSGNCCLCGTCGGYQCTAAGATAGDTLGKNVPTTGKFNLGKNNDNWGINANGDVVGNPGGHYDTAGNGGGLSGGGGTGCFLEGTKVMTLLGFKDIDKIKVGEMVLSYNTEKKTNEYKKVTQLHIHKDNTERLYTLIIDGQMLRVTEAHRIFIWHDDEYTLKKVSELSLGDYVMYSNGTLHRVDKITYELQTNTVYNLEVEDNHNYYVDYNQILVHNLK